MTDRYKKVISHCGAVIAAMDYSPMFAGTTVADTLRLAVRSILELDELIDNMPKAPSADMTADEVLVFLSEWHDWQNDVTKARRGDL